MIRLAELKDAKDCYEMAIRIYGEFAKEHGIEMVTEDLVKTADFLINAKQVMVIERGGKVVGMAAWIIVPHPANFKCRIWQEILWCCESPVKTDALAMLHAIEENAKDNADILILGNLSLENEPKLRRIYNRRGLTYMESHYAKRV